MQLSLMFCMSYFRDACASEISESFEVSSVYVCLRASCAVNEGAIRAF